MAKILKAKELEFTETPNRIDNFRLFTDISRVKKGIEPKNLHFDFRRLDPDEYSSLYHSHRYGEEFFMMLTGSATLRTPDGLHVVESGDLMFFETGEGGAHQLYNHTDQPCIFLDVRAYIGYDICDYPDSNKVLLVPSFEIFDSGAQLGYFDGEENVREKWRELREK